MNEQIITAEQTKEFVIEALGIAGFTENPDFPGIYTMELGMKKVVVDTTAGTSIYFLVNKQKVVEDDEHNTLAKLSQMIVEAEDGRMPTRSTPDEIVNVPRPSVVETMNPAEPTNEVPAEPIDNVSGGESVPAVPEPAQACASSAMPKLSIEIIKKYINDKVTDEEAYVFLELCKARGLNPFIGQVHLIKYDPVKPATMVLAKDTFIERAEANANYDGFEAGVIIKDKPGTKIRRPGAFVGTDEVLLGGWAKVYRKDHTHPVEAEVSMKEYNTGKASWGKIPATMIRKVALVQAHREGFPSELGGMYDQSEMGVEVSA